MKFNLTSHKLHSQLLRVRQKKMKNNAVKTRSEYTFSSDFSKEFKIALKTVNPENLIGLADHEPEFLVLDSRHVTFR